jgi:hypothetical protein
MNKIETMYNELVRSHSDINEHLPTLKRYAEECEHVTEMGVRWVVSTYAFAVAKPKTFISIDIRHPAEEEWDSRWKSGDRLKSIENYCKENEINYKFIQADTRKIEIEETDLLFIDTLHEYEQLKTELKLHADKARKYIIFHDTESFRFRNETDPSVQGTSNGIKLGIWPAIEEFLSDNKNWKINEVFTNCNGLTILKRINHD